jgi:hypothetical protein
MSWFRRRRTGAHEAPEDKKVEAAPVVTTEDIQRAEQAARLAALHLQAARDRRREVDRRAETLARLNKTNGFAELIRNAFGS